MVRKSLKLIIGGCVAIAVYSTRADVNHTWHVQQYVQLENLVLVDNKSFTYRSVAGKLKPDVDVEVRTSSATVGGSLTML